MFGDPNKTQTSPKLCTILQQNAVGDGKLRPGTATWWSEQNVRVVFDSVPFVLLCKNVSSTKSEVHNILRCCCHKRTDPRPQIIKSCIENLAKFGQKPFLGITISQKPLQLRWPNVTQNCSTMSPKNPFILGSKGQWSRSRGTEQCRRGSLHSCECWFLLARSESNN